MPARRVGGRRGEGVGAVGGVGVGVGGSGWGREWVGDGGG